MEETLKRFNEQFDWHPIVENPSQLVPLQRFIVAGMGGSHLGAWLIKSFDPRVELTIHRNYGLPAIPEIGLRSTLFIASSYSGKTEETLDAAKAAVEEGMHVAAISIGGSLLDFARENNLPFITIPDTGLEPRMAIGFAMIGIARLMGNVQLEAAIREGGKNVDPMAQRTQGYALAEKLVGKTPLIWSSEINVPIAYIWKVKFNETPKIPAFFNCFPELSHNEFTGFNVVDATRALSQNLHVLMLQDPNDHPRIQKRMSVARQMLIERNISVDVIALKGEHFEKMFLAAILGDWVALGLGKHYNGEADPTTPIIAEFKRRMAQP